MNLARDIRLSRPFANDGVQALLLLARTLTELLEPAQRLIRARGITPGQHNVLRILRGAGPAGLPAGEIASRMIARDPDITRLIDKLCKAGLVERRRADKDRRVVICVATRAGLALCRALEEPLNRLHEQQFARLGSRDTRRLIALLEKLRAANAAAAKENRG
ncbi:MAG: MarR family transcriptional regulator [Planctomycetes bacterium]|jgi:DNA-binding MarR family transcriptional regulator|nr:MarR family transcriptional regulator [Planctomycetota bacterium]MCL4729591.1 MarR family transcriptional regulator [Planctomycetota bacterium]